MTFSGKRILAALTLITVFAACSKEQSVSVVSADDGNGSLVFTAGFDTKTSVSPGGSTYSISWISGDLVSLFDGVSNNAFTAQSTGSSTTLKGKAANAGTYYALYPYSAGASLSGTVISTSIPSSVKASADGSTGFANLSVAKTSGTNLIFTTVAGVLRFILGGTLMNVSEIRISALGGEAIAGSVTIGMSGTPALTVAAGVSTISVTPASGSVFATGHSYYVAAAPGTLASGIKLEFVTPSGTVTKTQSKALTIKPGVVLNLGTIGDSSPSDGFAPAGYSLVWSDEFTDGEDLSDKWTFESGGTGWGNDELQYYCANGVYSRTGQQTAFVSDGTLKIKAYKVTPRSDTDNCSYISARMSTKDRWKYGYIEMKAKLPVEAGTWSAFWMLPNPNKYPSWVRDESCKGGELDIMEYVPNDNPDVYYFSAHSYNATPEAGRSSGYDDPTTGKHYPYYGQTDISNPGGKWHYFGMEWTHTYVKAFMDGQQFYYAPNPFPNYQPADSNPDWGFDKDFYIKLNLAIGGSWGGAVDKNFSESTYEIDWSRVYQ